MSERFVKQKFCRMYISSHIRGGAPYRVSYVTLRATCHNVLIYFAKIHATISELFPSVYRTDVAHVDNLSRIVFPFDETALRPNKFKIFNASAEGRRDRRSEREGTFRGYVAFAARGQKVMRDRAIFAGEKNRLPAGARRSAQ